MDFAFSETQRAIAESAAAIFEPRSARSPEVIPDPPAETWFDREVWRDLARTGALGITVPEALHGSGLGVMELCVMLMAQGRHLIRIPAVETLAVCAPAIDVYGSPSQRASLLPRIAEGDAVLVAAVNEPPRPEPSACGLEARSADADWCLQGVLHCVPFAGDADLLLVPAETENELAIFLIDPRADGVGLTPLRTTNGGPEYRVDLSGVVCGRDARLGEPGQGRAIFGYLLDRAVLGTCAVQVGLLEEALTLTATYLSTREQFGRPLATFQAVTMQMSDCYIDVECCRSTMWKAAWDLSQGVPAEQSLAIAKYWNAEAGRRVIGTVQHLHAGVGVDKTYPLHRYAVWAKRNELAYGSAGAHLAGLGSLLAQ
jgi:alkylation response protein AidB-like acyl-CoA dehydrogenase